MDDTADATCEVLDKCEGRIGDYVWFDENGNGCQDPEETGIENVEVCIYENADCASPGQGSLVACTTTDASGYYLFGNLECGRDYEIVFNRPDGFSETLPNSETCAGTPQESDQFDSDCVDGERVCVRLGEDTIVEDLTVDCGYVPECDISVDKKCLVEPAALGPFDCDDKVDALKMIWNGPGTLQGVTAYRGDVGNDETLPAVITTEVINGVDRQVVTVTGYQPSTNDVQWAWVSDSASGTSEFHLSCSDDEMDGPEDCGTPQGNGKSNDGGLANVWLLDGLTTDRDLVFDCTPQPLEADDECAFEASPVPGCKTDPEVNDLTSITFRYTGADCSASNNDQGEIGDKWNCLGEPGADPVNIVVIKDTGKTSTDAVSVNVGDTFTLSDDFSSESIVAVGGQTLTFHTSCSQPLAIGDVFGSLEVVGINGLSPGRAVTYFYEVTNNGGTSVQVASVFDDLLGEVLEEPRELPAGDSFTLESTTFISETTTNEVTAAAGLGQCEATDTVTVTVEEPTCAVSIQLDKIEDKKIKWKLSNPSSIAATIETLTIAWPGSTRLKKVKYDGSDILKDVLLSSPAEITQWLKEPKDRTVKAGDSGKTLELEFDADFPDKNDQDPADFQLEVTFEQGCGVVF